MLGGDGVQCEAGRLGIIKHAAADLSEDPGLFGRRLRCSFEPAQHLIQTGIPLYRGRPSRLVPVGLAAMWTCASLIPGMTSRPAASSTRVCDVASPRTSAFIPTALILSPVIATASAHFVAGTPVKMRALMMSSEGAGLGPMTRIAVGMTAVMRIVRRVPTTRHYHTCPPRYGIDGGPRESRPRYVLGVSGCGVRITKPTAYEE